MSLQNDTSAPWGKAVKDQLHPLICHICDTAAVARRIFRRIVGPNARDELLAGFAPLGDADDWIGWLCGLHDLGKASPSFQALRIDVAASRLSKVLADDVLRLARQRELNRRIDTPHGLVTAIHMKNLLTAWGTPRSTAERIAVALGGHHGHFPDGSLLSQARREINNRGFASWEDARDDLVRESARLRGLPDPADQPWCEIQISESAALSFAATTAVSDWIASDPTNFPLTDGMDLDQYATLSEQRAEDAVARLNLQAWSPPREFHGLFPGVSPRPVQEVVADLVADRDEPTLLLVEAPTGEGKSKAALHAAAVLVRNLDLMGIYMAMPTQATSNQMLREVEELAAGASVRLVHGNAKEYLRSRATVPVGVGEDEQDDSDVAAQEWFTRKSSLLASLGVGTVDQALKAVIRSKHVFVPLVALSNKVVVIDEIHGYETYMSTLLDRLLLWLGRLGVSVVMLSATLPSHRRQELVAAWQAGALRCLPAEAPRIEPSVAYPAVTIAGKGRPRIVPAGVSDLNGRRTMVLERVRNDQVIDWVTTRSGNGSVAVMHNLVRRAMATYVALEKRIAEMDESERPQLVMINGQLPPGERAKVEGWLTEASGPNGTRPKAIVVATQVLEQGLDLDFDTVLTDLAPVDWLIQRSGRLHRHRQEVSRGMPTLGITGVEDHIDAPPTFPRYVNLVYAPAILLRTWALLRHRAELSMPAESTDLIEAVYGPDDAITCPLGWEPIWSNAAENLRRARDRKDRNARVMYLPLPSAAGDLSELTKHSRNPSQTRERRRRS